MTIARKSTVKFTTVLCVALSLAGFAPRAKANDTTLRRALRDWPMPRVQFHFNPQVLTIR